MTMQVRDGHDRRDVGFHNEEHSEREAMKNGSSKLLKDTRKVLRRALDPCEGGAKFSEEFGPKAHSFAFVPRRCLKRIEFCLGPDVESGHLPRRTKTLLNPFDDLLPRPAVAW